MKLRGILLSSIVAVLLLGCGATAPRSSEPKPDCAAVSSADAKHPYAMPLGDPWKCEVRP